MSGPTAEPIPPGFRLHLDPSVKLLRPDLLAGGVPNRVLRLTEAGMRAWAALAAGTVSTPADGLLARRLTDAGLAHPVPPAGAGPALADVTVVVPVLDRPRELDRCLGALAGTVPVLVVDDGSADPDTVAKVAAEHGARLVRREINGGPAAARNTALEALGPADVVAFLDSDCEAPPGWLEPLLAHLADPLVAAVAPRIVGTAEHTWAGRYTVARGNLDLGGEPSRVRADARVAYVPTAALVARVSALRSVARGGYVFEPSLRFGEDVDLVWRLDAAGWRVRYQPEVEVRHHEPGQWRPLLARRFRYGTSAGPLAAAHPQLTAPLVLMPWHAVAVGAVLARRPITAAVATAGAAVTMRRLLHRADVPTAGTTVATLRGVHGTWLGSGRYVTQFAAPLAVAAVAAPGSRGRRLAAASLLLGGAANAWWPRRRALDPIRFTAGYLADEIAYGAGVWASCVRGRTLAPLSPRIPLRPHVPLRPRIPLRPGGAPRAAASSRPVPPVPTKETTR